jgi:trehalose 6-phosphate phosphatase
VPPEPPPSVADLRADPARTAIVTDFDGTLSPIVEDPAQARPLPGVVDALHALAQRYRRVAVVSGRPVAFLRDRLELDHRPASSLFVSGLYGIEWMEDGVERAHEVAHRFRPLVDEAAAQAEASAPDGVHVERKGFSVTIHVRNAPQHEGWARSWAEATAHTTGLALHPARRSFELRPPVDLDKGTVVDALIAEAGAACFLGDDLGDLPAFDALDRRRAASGARTVRVAVRSSEAPPELLERADVVVDGPEGSLAFLRSLLDD